MNETKFYIVTTTEGCATNLLENADWRTYYKSLGYKVSANLESADLIIINTCAYNQEMEDCASKHIRNLQARYPKKKFVVTGCYPKINPQRLSSIYQGKILDRNASPIPHANFFEAQDFKNLSSKHQVILKMRPVYSKIEIMLGRQFIPLHNIFESIIVNDKFYLITISQGCLGHCTYCSIKFSKGPLRSRPMEDIIDSFRTGLQKGYRKFWLLGDDIGCWGQDIGQDVSALLKLILAQKEKFDLVLNYFDPKYLVRYQNQMESAWADPRLTCVNIPLQSGCKKILKRMGRNYSPSEVFSVIEKIKKSNRAMAIKTNFMVGFPGETWSDFWQTITAVFFFDAAVAMKFTPRPNTAAEKFEGQISNLVKNLRFGIINVFIFLRHGWTLAASLRHPTIPAQTKEMDGQS
jgi:threonylcarbamoyladenosine tRNA methylthiotransferase MtaB